MKKDLSIIIPCYNEGEKLIDNIKKIKSYLSTINLTNYEIIIVNDGSKDNTDTVCLDISKKNKNVLYYSYPINQGKGEAVRVGIKNSTGNWVLFMDADLSTDLKAIEDVMNIKKNNNVSVIIGSRRHKDTLLVKKQNIIRQLTGKTCSIITNLILPLHINDTQCGFKAFDGNFARKMIKYQQLKGFAFDVEYLFMANLANKEIQEIGVKWENDDDSKVSLIKSSLKFFSDLFKIRKNKKIYISLLEE